MYRGILFTAIVFLQIICSATIAKTRFVGPEGSDANPGTMQLPYESLQYAVERLVPGDTLFILEGTYRQQVKKNFLRGQEENPIVISAFPGHRVVIDGTVDITTDWELHEGSIYRTVLDTTIWQLFVDDKMMTSARWPNARAWTKDMWNTDKTWGHQAAGSSYGHFIDDGRKRLAASGRDFTGAIAIMNIGSWLSFAEKVDSHGAGTSDFHYTPHFSEGQYHHHITNGRYFFEAAYVCLDAPTEWYFNPDTRELFLVPEDGLNPNGRRIRGKTVTYALEFNEARYLEIRDIDFFGCTVKLELSRYSTLENCDFLFPSYSKRMLGSINFAQPTLVSSGSDGIVSRNRVINCSFEKTDGSGLKIVGKYDLVENCYFHNIDYSCVGGLNDITVAAVSTNNFTFRYNTIDMGGNSLGVKTGNSCVVEYNRVSNIGFLQHDGSAIQTSSNNLAGVVFRRNWVSDCIKAALRFDSPWTRPEIYGKYGTMIYNVSWRSRPMVPKGDYHKIYNNTAFDNENFDISIFSDVSHGGVNTHTVTRNNALNIFSGANVTGITPISGIHDHNWEGIRFNPDRDVKDQLYDPANLDFRPRPGSELVDAGLLEQGVTEGFIGASPDIGAYEFGDTVYWMAGRRHAYASSPIPAEGGTSHYEFVDLIWLVGYRSDSSDIYFGTSELAVSNATRASDEYNGTQRNNIFYPGGLEKGQVYYWRVDAVRSDSTTKGETWSFTAGMDSNPIVFQVDYRIFSRKDSITLPLDRALIQMNDRRAMTAADGTATFPMLKEGQYQLGITRKGYLALSRQVSVYTDTSFTDTLDYTTYNMSLRVKDMDSGFDIDSAEVNINEQLFYTDNAGAIDLTGVEYGWYRLEVLFPGYQPLEGVLIEVFSDTVITLELEKLRLTATMNVEDRVSGMPIKRALVHYNDQVKVTNSSGEFTDDQLNQGTWVFTVEHNDYFSLTDSIVLDSDTSLVIGMTPKVASIQFEISDGADALSGARVQIGSLSLVSSMDGEVKFLSLKAREFHQYLITKEGYEDAEGALYLEIDTVVSVVLSQISGVPVSQKTDLILTYPNPAKDELHLLLPEEQAHAELLDLNGRVVHIQLLNMKSEVLDVSGLEAGGYFLKIRTGTDIYYSKIQIIN